MQGEGADSRADFSLLLTRFVQCLLLLSQEHLLLLYAIKASEISTHVVTAQGLTSQLKFRNIPLIRPVENQAFKISFDYITENL